MTHCISENITETGDRLGHDSYVVPTPGGSCLGLKIGYFVTGSSDARLYENSTHILRLFGPLSVYCSLGET